MIVLAALFGQTIYHIVLVIGLLSWMSVTLRGARPGAHAQGARLREPRAFTWAPATSTSSAATSSPTWRRCWSLRPCSPSPPRCSSKQRLPSSVWATRQRVSWGTIIENAFLHSAVSVGAWWAIVPPGRLHRRRRARQLPHRPGRRGSHEPAPRQRPRFAAVLLPARTRLPRTCDERPRAHRPARLVRRPRRALGARRARRRPHGRGRRARRRARRVGLRQDDADPRRHGPAARRSPRSAASVRLDGVDVLAHGEESAREVRWTHAAMVFQGAMSAMNPVHRVGKQIADPMVFHKQAQPGRGARAHARGARARRPPGLGRAPVPARTLRRHAPARCDRHGRGVRAQGAVRRRADDRARRRRAGTDRRPARGPHRAARPRPRDGHPRHRHDRRDGERAVVMYAGVVVEDGRTIDVLTAPAPSLHATASRGDAGGQSRPPAGLHPRHAAAARRAGQRLRLRARAARTRSRPAPCARSSLGDGHVVACHALAEGRLS